MNRLKIKYAVAYGFLAATALALSTTILGLCIAIPAIVGNSYLNRKIDKLCAQINICVERLIDIRRESGK